MNWKLYLKNNWTVLVANGLFLWILLMMFGIFYILQNDVAVIDYSKDWIEIFSTIRYPFYECGMILCIGLFVMLVFKFLKKNSVVIVLGILTILSFYWKMKIIGIT